MGLQLLFGEGLASEVPAKSSQNTINFVLGANTKKIKGFQPALISEKSYPRHEFHKYIDIKICLLCSIVKYYSLMSQIL